jgi:ribonuclease HI
MVITGYTDGAASKNGTADCIAGWAFVLLGDDESLIAEDSGRVENGTNNIGELQAIINAIKVAAKFNYDRLVIYSDSAYCINGITNWRYNWKRNNWWRDRAQTQVLKNKDMWIELDHLIDSSKMEFVKCSGHSGVKWNEYVDKAAVKHTRGTK